MTTDTIDMTTLPSFHADVGIEANWQPISAYDKEHGGPVLLRGAGQAVLGTWEAVEGEGPTWRSAEDSTLDAPLWFGPSEFAVLSTDDEQTYLER